MATDVDGQLQVFFLMGRSITHFQLRLAQFVTGCTHADIEDRLTEDWLRSTDQFYMYTLYQINHMSLLSLIVIM